MLPGLPRETRSTDTTPTTCHNHFSPVPGPELPDTGTPAGSPPVSNTRNQDTRTCPASVSTARDRNPSTDPTPAHSRTRITRDESVEPMLVRNDRRNPGTILLVRHLGFEAEISFLALLSLVGKSAGHHHGVPVCRRGSANAILFSAIAGAARRSMTPLPLPISSPPCPTDSMHPVHH